MKTGEIHPLAVVLCQNVPQTTKIWQFSVVLEGAQIGAGCNICCHTFVENDVIIGNNVTLKSGVYLWDGIVLEDNVFVGPNVSFTNDKYPRSRQHLSEIERTYVRQGVSIGAGAVLVGPLEIGKYAMIGAGAVVTKSVPEFALVVGNPAKVVGTVNENGDIISRL